MSSSSRSASARSCSTGCRRRRSGSTCSACRRCPSETLLLIGFLGHHRRGGARGDAVRRRRRHGRRAPADRGRLPHRPLPDLPADRRPAHRHRHLGSVPAGWDLFGTAFYEVSGSWLPPGLVWTVQLAAVVGGHMLGAWGGHVVAALEAPPGMSASTLRNRQIPLAVVMVALTTLTLWSLGQSIVVTPEEVAPAAQTVATSRAAADRAPAPTRRASGRSRPRRRSRGRGPRRPRPRSPSRSGTGSPPRSRRGGSRPRRGPPRSAASAC